MIDRCGHCGNVTKLEERGGYEHIGSIPNKVNNTWDVIRVSWQVYECVTCLEPTLVKFVYGPQINYSVSVQEKQLYPVSEAPLTNLPQNIEKAYLASIKVKNIEPNACAVLVGRTLEAACNHEQAQGRTLAQKLNYLAQNGRIPNTLVEMARQLKELRNLGAHDAEDEVTEEDVPVILDFLEAILEYLYVAPAKIEAVRARLTRSTSPENASIDT